MISTIMKPILSFVLLFITSCFGYSQTERSQNIIDRVYNFTKEQKIDTFMVYWYPCNFSIESDSCKDQVPMYLLWEKNGYSYLKRFDECNAFKSIQLSKTNPLVFCLKYRAIIDTEVILPPTTYQFVKKKDKVDTIIMRSTISHFCNYIFILPFSTKGEEKSVSSFDLEYGSNKEQNNINYKHNKKTKFESLVDLTKSLIESLNKENKFVPE